MSNHIDDPLKLRWDEETNQYKTNKPNINEAELIDANIGVELLIILHNARLVLLKMEGLSPTIDEQLKELSRGIDLLTGTEQLTT